MNAWAALRLQIEWGADEALETVPVDRLRPIGTVAPDAPSPRLGRFSNETTAPGAPPDVKSGFGAPSGAANRAAEQAAALAAGATTIAELRAAVAAFTGCALRDTATSLVFAEGDAAPSLIAPSLMLIGDAPGPDDDRAGRPFAGASGAYLDRMLASIGLNRDMLLLTPVIPWRPPGDRMPSPTELAACLPFLWRLIILAAPSHVMLLGPIAARNLLPANPRRRTRGAWVNLAVPGMLAKVPALSGISPAALLRQPSLRREAWADLRKIRRAIDKNITKP